MIERTPLDDLIEKLDKLDGRRVRVDVERSIDLSDNTRGDSAEQIAAALRRRKIVRER